MKALGNDIEKNLEQPLAEMREAAQCEGQTLADVRVAVRSGDTPQRDRRLHLRKPPHILITTPESLYILLTAEGSRAILRTARTVIVDEIHALAPNKRGCHLALTLERLDDLCGRRLQRIGLSATQRPIAEVARFLTGVTGEGAERECAIVDAGHRRDMDLRVETTASPLGPIATHELRAEIFDRMAELIRTHRTTIVFSDTRRMVERIAHELGERLGEERVAAHHGSLSRHTRMRAEQRLKQGEISVIVASASLELGIDVGHVDLVCQLGAPRSIATLLQRVGRSGHYLGATPRGRLFPTTRDELLQCAAAVRACLRGELDRLEIPRPPRDILAQQIVAHVACGERTQDDTWALMRRAYPYRNFTRRDFDHIVDTLADGVSTRRGRRSAQLHRDRVHGSLRARRGARLTAITNAGAIPDVADYDVIDDATETRIGSVNEDFAIESLAGDIFLLGNRSWRIRRVESGRIRVTDANGAPPSIPFWLGEAPARTYELSAALAALRNDVAERLPATADLIEWICAECRVDRDGGTEVAEHIAATVASLGTVPAMNRVIAERFFDEAGGMQLVLHTPFGARINRALGLALRKRFCVSFDFELQAAATDDGVVLSLGEQHSFALDSVFSMLHPQTFEADLVQAALVSPMFTNRWRWNATRSLALLRFAGGKKVPMPLQRMRAEDLLAAVFPAQLACGDNRSGPIEVPRHPLVDETIENCLHEAMDTDGLRTLLENINAGVVDTHAVETAAPSPASHEILNANPYAFLDDAPLEERRARAVALRRTNPDLCDGIGALSATAISEVCRQAWPIVRDADEAHDALLSLIAVGATDAEPWRTYLEDLMTSARVVRLAGEQTIYVAVENLAHARALWPRATATPDAAPPAGAPTKSTAADAAYLLVRGWMEHCGPATTRDLARRIGIEAPQTAAALARLESDGVVLRGAFTPHSETDGEFCERGLLARIHRRTLGDLRREIEPASPAELMRFLFRWQHLDNRTRLHGRAGVAAVIDQLEGLEIAAHAWEDTILPSRVANYDPSFLDELCLSGEVAWGRIGTPKDGNRRAPGRNAKIAIFHRGSADLLIAPNSEREDATADPIQRAVLAHLAANGASFANDIARALQASIDDVETALWSLVANGSITGDGFAGVRRLINRHTHRAAPARALAVSLVAGHSRRARKAATRITAAGRWSLLHPAVETSDDERRQASAWRVLRRYGVVTRELCKRDRNLPPWRDLLRELRRLEARGEVRGGRFVSGFPGEHFALPDAVAALRSQRRQKDPGETTIAAADPLNLTGIITAGSRRPSSSTQTITYRYGVPVDGDVATTTRSA